MSANRDMDDGASIYSSGSDLTNMTAAILQGTRWTDFPSFGNSIVHTSVPSDTVDQLLGRRLSAQPAHLTRVLYIPRHDRRATHLPLYDVSHDYALATQDAQMGSCKYKINLSLMRRPAGDRPGDDARYLLDVHGDCQAQLRRRSGQVTMHETTVSLPRSNAMTFALDSYSGDQVTRSMARVTFPLADQQTPSGRVRFPYYELRSEQAGGPKLQWQIQPHEHGALRYTLVDSTAGCEPVVKAIYHHVGLGINLPSDYSEGVLLLPPGEDGCDEEWVVASLLGLLWHVRELHSKRRRPMLKRLLGRL